MGDPKKQRRKYSRPEHLWRSERIIEENEICKKYGLENKRELWKIKSKVRTFRKQARKLLSMKGEEAKKEKTELLSKLRKLGMEIKTLEDVLALKVESLLDRRLQSIVHKKGLSDTPKQARQFITHGHVLVQNRVVNFPSYLVLKDEEDKINLKDNIRVIKFEGKRKGKKEKTPAAGEKRGQ